MMHESNKVRQTKGKITDALFAILATSPIERITVAEVCAKAGVNRSTFYNHFTDIYDVRDCYEEKLLNDVDAVISQLMAAIFLKEGNLAFQSIESVLEPHFEKIAILLNGGDFHFGDKMVGLARKNLLTILGKDSFSEKESYIFSGIGGMQLGLIRHWLSNDRSLSLEEVVLLMQGFIQQGPRATLLQNI